MLRHWQSGPMLPYMYVTPISVLLFLICVFPLGYNFYMSLHSYDILNPEDYGFVGLSNYYRAITDVDFWNSLGVTLLFSSFAVTLEMILGFSIAILLNRHSTLSRQIYRTLMMLPIIMTPVAVSFMWRVIYAPSSGILNYILRSVSIPAPLWVADPHWALPSLIIVDVWQWTPFLALIFLSGLMSLPPEPLEAAKIDGASVLQSFWFVTAPLMRPIIVIAVLIRLIDSFKLFDIVYAMTGGGPLRATEALNFFIYRIAFKELDIGYACALTITLLSLICLLSLGFIRAGRIYDSV
jgi:multiple sugar transport system permease protein